MLIKRSNRKQLIWHGLGMEETAAGMADSPRPLKLAVVRKLAGFPKKIAAPASVRNWPGRISSQANIPL
ncbi:MAG: hypothetical protein A3H94_00255 [Acidobacteria bacterium RIFCSPLOWO2_02_FULL_60_20]|nr:MAG: hypothetical protein A3H94_00255 [Acidobacteria bacterium RIFCSPLOWO2_02_FULL_60_20]OFW02884.1 MAG: hypothetical protein A3G20_08580 [Acidobacteria bacterium RIFCSPLOWO2_12_FULL_59_11]